MNISVKHQEQSLTQIVPSKGSVTHIFISNPRPRPALPDNGSAARTSLLPRLSLVTMVCAGHSLERVLDGGGVQVFISLSSHS